MYAVCRGVSVSIYSSISVSVSISALVVLMEKLSARRRRRALHFFGYFTFGQSMWRLFVTATPPSSQSQSREALASQPATCPDFSLQSSDLKYSTRLRGYYARRSRVSIPHKTCSWTSSHIWRRRAQARKTQSHSIRVWGCLRVPINTHWVFHLCAGRKLYKYTDMYHERSDLNWRS